MTDERGLEIVSCGAAYGQGGLGRHFAQLVEDARGRGVLQAYFTVRGRPGDADVLRVVDDRLKRFVLAYTPVRFSRGWRDLTAAELFDRSVAAALPACETFVGFAGKAQHSFRRARRLGAEQLVLQAPNSHIGRLARCHQSARLAHGVEGSWLTSRHCRKALLEYGLADVITVNSEYVRESFLEQGFPEERLRRIRLIPDPRFKPPVERPADGCFRVVYVGGLTVAKGVPLLLEAFGRLRDPHARLALVGGPSTRAMRRFLARWIARDPRVVLRPGDPLPELHRADVYVHPSYEEGFGYAPAEAMATALPVILSADTGAKELVVEGKNGWVVPTGDLEALYERLCFVHDLRPRLPAAGVPDFG